MLHQVIPDPSYCGTFCNSDCKLKVMAFENMGNEQLVYLTLGVQTIIARTPPVEAAEIGSYVGVRFSRDKMIFMDEESVEVVGG